MSKKLKMKNIKTQRKRPLIAFFDYHDVFEDFYPHYGVSQQNFATTWNDTASHTWLSLIQRDIGDVIWYMFSLSPEISEARHEVIGCQVKFIQSPWLQRCLWRAFYLPRCAWRWRRFYRTYGTIASYLTLASLAFIRTLQRDKPDIIFVQDYSSGKFDMLVFMAHILSIPLIARHTGSQPDFYLGKILRRWTLPLAKWFIASSQGELEMLETRYKIPHERIKIILTPIDMTVFRPLERTDACIATGIKPERRYILFMGRFVDGIKRISALIKTFTAIASEFPNVDLLLVGNGPDEEKLQRFAMESAPNRIIFLGWVSDDNAKVQLYNTAECLVLPSLREGFPAVVGEAMSCGTPVLASKVGGVGELVVEDQTGWLLRPGDDEALTSKLSFILAHPQIVDSMRPQVRRSAEARLSPAVVAAALKECFSMGDELYG